MDECPRCGREVDELHFLPPEVITRDLLDAFEGEPWEGDHETCDDCVRALMES